MTDRELLEFAAKAAGWVSWDWLAGEYLNVYDAEGRHDTFNPINNDGEALRLAVKLRISLQFDFDRIDAVAEDGEICETGYIYDNPKTDEGAAARRAIVRAAAAIGEKL